MAQTTPSVGNAFRTTLDLFETGLGLMRQNLRREIIPKRRTRKSTADFANGSMTGQERNLVIVPGGL